jgi:hypothetical protein
MQNHPSIEIPSPPPIAWEVQTAFFGYWENCWTVDGEPHTFPNEKSALAELKDFLKDQHQAVEAGDMDEKYSREDYRIRLCGPDIQYVVLNEHTIGVLRKNNSFNLMEVLACSVLKGGHHWFNGPVTVSGAKLRPATASDFEFFRLSPPPEFR